MTDAQAAGQLVKILDGVWRRGDRDERSWKHVNHCLAAIIAGGAWTDAIDYERPWDVDWQPPKSWETDLAKRWGKVQRIHDAIGNDRFTEIVTERVPIATHITFYLEHHYPRQD